jgi:hypothetical protein
MQRAATSIGRSEGSDPIRKNRKKTQENKSKQRDEEEEWGREVKSDPGDTKAERRKVMEAERDREGIGQNSREVDGKVKERPLDKKVREGEIGKKERGSRRKEKRRTHSEHRQNYKMGERQEGKVAG